MDGANASMQDGNVTGSVSSRNLRRDRLKC